MRLWQRVMGENGEGTMVPFTLENLDPNRKALICCPGMLVTEENGEASIQQLGTLFVGTASRLLGNQDIDTKVQFLCVSYVDECEPTFNIALYNQNPNHHYCKEAEALARSFFVPRLVDAQHRRLTPKALEAVAQAMHNVTFFTYSYGSVFAGEVANALSVRMHVLGYTEEERISVLQNIHVLSFGNIANVTALHYPKFSGISISGTNDIVACQKWPGFREHVDRDRQDNLVVHKLPGNRLHVEMRLPTEHVRWTKSNGFLEHRRERDSNAHNVALYTTAGIRCDAHNKNWRDPHNIVPYIVETTLNNMVFRDGTEDIRDMLRPIRSIQRRGTMRVPPTPALQQVITEGFVRGHSQSR